MTQLVKVAIPVVMLHNSILTLKKVQNKKGKKGADFPLQTQENSLS